MGKDRDPISSLFGGNQEKKEERSPDLENILVPSFFPLVQRKGDEKEERKLYSLYGKWFTLKEFLDEAGKELKNLVSGSTKRNYMDSLSGLERTVYIQGGKDPWVIQAEINGEAHDSKLWIEDDVLEIIPPDIREYNEHRIHGVVDGVQHIFGNEPVTGTGEEIERDAEMKLKEYLYDSLQNYFDERELNDTHPRKEKYRKSTILHEAGIPASVQNTFNISAKDILDDSLMVSFSLPKYKSLNESGALLDYFELVEQPPIRYDELVPSHRKRSQNISQIPVEESEIWDDSDTGLGKKDYKMLVLDKWNSTKDMLRRGLDEKKDLGVLVLDKWNSAKVKLREGRDEIINDVRDLAGLGVAYSHSAKDSLRNGLDEIFNDAKNMTGLRMAYSPRLTPQAEYATDEYRDKMKTQTETSDRKRGTMFGSGYEKAAAIGVLGLALAVGLPRHMDIEDYNPLIQTETSHAVPADTSIAGQNSTTNQDNKIPQEKKISDYRISIEDKSFSVDYDWVNTFTSNDIGKLAKQGGPWIIIRDHMFNRKLSEEETELVLSSVGGKVGIDIYDNSLDVESGGPAGLLNNQFRDNYSIDEVQSIMQKITDMIEPVYEEIKPANDSEKTAQEIRMEDGNFNLVQNEILHETTDSSDYSHHKVYRSEPLWAGKEPERKDSNPYKKNVLYMADPLFPKSSELETIDDLVDGMPPEPGFQSTPSVSDLYEEFKNAHEGNIDIRTALDVCNGMRSLQAREKQFQTYETWTQLKNETPDITKRELADILGESYRTTLDRISREDVLRKQGQNAFTYQGSISSIRI